METTVPSNIPTTIVPQNQPVKNSRRYNTVSRGFFYYFAFLTALASLLLGIIAITKDELTKVSFYSSGNHLFTEYCGWHNVHFDNSGSYTQNVAQYPYSKFCSSDNHACRLTKSGRAWYGLIIISVVLEGLALIAFIFDFAHPAAYSIILLFNLLSFLCTLAAVLTWGIRDYCGNSCNSLNFPYSSTGGASRCDSEFAISWILTVIAGGFSLVAFLSLIISRMVDGPKQQY